MFTTVRREDVKKPAAPSPADAKARGADGGGGLSLGMFVGAEEAPKGSMWRGFASSESATKGKGEAPWAFLGGGAGGGRAGGGGGSGRSAGGGWFGSAAPKAMDAVWDPFAAVRGPGLVLGKGKAPGEVVITGIEKGGPVDRQSGVLRVGDVVVGVDDEAVRGLSVDTVSSKLRGPTGSSVRIKALRRGMTGEEHVTPPPSPY